MTDPEISVLIPTRDRAQLLFQSVTSLMKTAADSRRVDFWVAVDPDDEFELTFPSAATVHIWTAPERFGYDRLHEYYNQLARDAQGKWLFLWNDDAIMRTPGWDAVVVSQPETKLLWVQANHHETGNLFPIWPKSWSDAMGHVSLSPNCDRWLSEIGRMLDAEYRIPVEVFHSRADITGQNNDRTYREGRALMGDADHRDFHSAANVAARHEDADTVWGLLYDQQAG